MLLLANVELTFTRADHRYRELLAAIDPLPCRDDLATLANATFFSSGRAAEIGVFRGQFAKHNLQIWRGEYFAIDAWAHRDDKKLTEDAKKQDKNEKNSMQDQIYRAAQQSINASGASPDRVHVIRRKSEDAVGDFPDAHFDWIYVDTLHTFTATALELRRWWPKLRPGGLFSGDDYADHLDTPHLPTSRSWPVYLKRNVQTAHILPDYKWGVVRATQEFAKEVGAPLMVTWFQDCYFFPAWWMVKPFDHES